MLITILNSTKNSRGAIFAETALAFPLMVFFLFSVTDFALLLNTYSKGNTILRESLRYGATLPNLARSPTSWGNEAATYPDFPLPDASFDSSVTSSASNGYAAPGTAHAALFGRALDLQPALVMRLNGNIRVLSRCFPARNILGSNPPQPDLAFPKLRISVIGNYQGLFGPASIFYWVGINNLPLSLTAETKYFINNCL